MILNKSLFRRLKQILLAYGLLSGLGGFPLVFAFICIGAISSLMGEGDDVQLGLSLFLMALITFGVGWSLALHSSRSLSNKESKVIQFWPVWNLISLFGMVVLIGGVTSLDWFAALFFPPTLAFAATLPPLAAVSWFANKQNPDLTWRRGVLAFISGSTVSIILTIVLEILLLSIIFSLVVSLGRQALLQIELLLHILTGRNFSTIINNTNYTYLLVHLVIIAPIIEELVKPLAILPLTSRLSRQGAFLVGAMAGVGFAALENIIYAGFGFSVGANC